MVGFRDKLLICIVWVGTLGTPMWAQNQTTAWVSNDAGKAYIFRRDSLIELDFHLGTRRVMVNALWQALDSFPTLGESNQALRHPKPYIHSSPDSTLISFPGSGVVYGLDAKGRPVRLDNTYYGGYNFDSFRVIYNGALYSLGGTGFWHRHGLVLYFDRTLLEWEKSTRFYGMPDEYTMSFGACEDSSSVIMCNRPDGKLDPNLTDYRMYRVKLESGEVESVGVFSLDDGSREHKITPIGYIRQFAFVEVDGVLFVGDVRSNKLYHWKDLLAGTGPFNGFIGVLLQNETVHLIYSASTITNPRVRINQVAYEDVLNYCEDTGMPLYRTTAEQLWWRYTKEFIILFFSLVFLVVFLVRYNLRQPAVEKEFVNLLNPQEVRLLRHLILLPTGRSADIQEIDMLLELGGKSWENQRKIRSKRLANINAKADELLGYRDFIERVPHPEDKRARLYHISPEYRNVSPTLLRHL